MYQIHHITLLHVNPVSKRRQYTKQIKKIRSIMTKIIGHVPVASIYEVSVLVKQHSLGGRTIEAA